MLAGGWRNFIIAVPVNYVWSWASILTQTVTAVTVTPRAGYRFNLGRFGVLTAYTGATYLKADIPIELSMKFDTSDSGIPELGDETELNVDGLPGQQGSLEHARRRELGDSQVAEPSLRRWFPRLQDERRRLADVPVLTRIPSGSDRRSARCPADPAAIPVRAPWPRVVG